MFEENFKYFKAFKDAVNSGREVILDNSLFELGESFEPSRYAYWIEELVPTWYIIPDTLGDGPDTIRKYDEWMEQYGNFVPGKTIAVAQGKDRGELIACYDYLVDKVDMIAISFGNQFFVDEYPNEPTKYHSYMKGRIALVKHMHDQGIIDPNVPHHLLGCGLPQEFKAYADYEFISSVDTSNPVSHGMNDIKYTDDGLEDKLSMLMVDHLNDQITVDIKDVILYNIDKFNEFCEGVK